MKTLSLSLSLLVTVSIGILLVAPSVCIPLNSGDISSIIANNPDIKKNVLNAITSTESKPTEMQNDFDNYAFNYRCDGSANIYCLKGSDAVGVITFYPDGTTPVPIAGVVEDQVYKGKFYPQLYYPINRFDDVMNILRYTNSSSLIIYASDTGSSGLQSLFNALV